MGCNHIVESGSCTRDSSIRDLVRFLLEASDRSGVVDAILWG